MTQAKTGTGHQVIQHRLDARNQVALFGFQQDIEQADDAKFEIGREVARFAFVDEQHIGAEL
jgi:hypothetical protein